MTSINPELLITLEDAVADVLGQLTGLDLDYDPNEDRFRAITRQLNKALRLNALEHEWSYYADTVDIGTAEVGDEVFTMSSTQRVRQTGDDSIRFVDTAGVPLLWAYFLPRDALHKYRAMAGMWASVVRREIVLSRPITRNEEGLRVLVPIMREPRMFRLPEIPADPDEDLPAVPDSILHQPVDFAYPDVVTMRAAALYAATDPVLQPRVPTLEAAYKDLMYQIIERDDRATDSPYINEFQLPVTNGLEGMDVSYHGHPHANQIRRW